jgi:hypothetical protein
VLVTLYHGLQLTLKKAIRMVTLNIIFGVARQWQHGHDSTLLIPGGSNLNGEVAFGKEALHSHLLLYEANVSINLLCRGR